MDPYASYSKLAVSSEQASQQPLIGLERRKMYLRSLRLMADNKWKPRRVQSIKRRAGFPGAD
jgi:hypothetical protein